MSEESNRHRLLVILAADAAGYSRLMAEDDRATLGSLDQARAVFRQQIELHGGRVVDMAGDSVLSVFDVAGGAVNAALAIQPRLAVLNEGVPESRRMMFRIGVHLGDVIEKSDGTVYGDGVNIASRLQTLAEPGGITISQAVRGVVANRVEAQFDDLGEHSVKNIAQPLRVYGVWAGRRADGQATSPARAAEDSASRPDWNNLPLGLASLFGRDADLTALTQLLSTQRLVTIVGAGGIGKTRLAQAAARQRIGVHKHGVWWIDLAVLASPDKIVPAIASAASLELGDGDAMTMLARSLSPRDTLLVLDNCEHLIADVAQVVSGALGAAPQLRVLATSQEALKLPEEHIYRLGALDVPPPDASLAEARGFGALQLLEQRAQSIDRNFALSEESVAGAIELCRHLDGVALAIEMAAARLPLLGIDEVRHRLGERFQMLRNPGRTAPARQQTLRATLEWSHSLLTAAEQAVLRRLSVFVGSFRLDAAQYVAATGDVDEWAALDALGTLTDKSLVQIERVDPRRYRLLETVRMYASEQLVAWGEADETRRRHCQAMTRLAEEADRAFWVTADAPWSDRYSPDGDDCQAGFWHACSTGDAMAACALGRALRRRDFLPSWVERGEWRRRAEAVHRLLASAPSRAQALVWDMVAACWPLVVAGAPNVSAAREAVAAWRQLDDKRELYLALVTLGHQSAAVGDFDEAASALDEAGRIEESDWPPRVRWALAFAVAAVGLYRGDPNSYLLGARRELALAEQAGARRAAAMGRLRLADAASMAGNFEEAIALGRAATAEQRAMVGTPRLVDVLAVLCGALLMNGDLEAARCAALEAWPLAVRSDWTGDHLSHVGLLAARTCRFAQAAEMLGHAQTWFAARPGAIEPNQLRSMKLARSAIETALELAERERLLASGERMGSAEIDALVRSVLAVPIEQRGRGSPGCDS